MTGCSYPPTYDGIGADEYMEWEIAIDNIFANCFMCPRRKVNNAASVLRHSALTWWESLSPLDKPQTWDDMKIVMRENFVNPSLAINSNDEVNHLEEESTVISLAMPNLLQDNVHKQEDDMEDHEELTTSCANSEPSLHNAPINPAENIGNNHGATLTEGENSLDVLTFSTNHAMMEKTLVNSSLDLSLSHNDLFDVLCDKDDMHDDIPMPPMINDNAICVLKSNIYAKNKYVIHNDSDIDELQLLSSLNTLGYLNLMFYAILVIWRRNFMHILICHGFLDTHIMFLVKTTTKVII